MPGRDPDKPAGGPSLPAEARWNRVSAKAEPAPPKHAGIGSVRRRVNLEPLWRV